MKLIQTLTFLGKHCLFFHNTKSDKREVASLICPSNINAEDSYTWNGKIQIPPICPSFNSHISTCKIISIAYYIVLHADVNMVSIGSHIMIPLTIGSVPIQDLNNPGSRPCSAPSYESCMYGAELLLKNDKKSNESKGEMLYTDETTFVPVYPYFKDF